MATDVDQVTGGREPAAMPAYRDLLKEDPNREERDDNSQNGHTSIVHLDRSRRNLSTEVSFGLCDL